MSSTANAGTTTVTPASNEADRAAVRRATPVVGILAFVIAAALSVLKHNTTMELVIDLAAQVIAVGVLYFVVIPRALKHPAAGVRALILGLIGLALVFPAFWSGLPLVFGAAAALLGIAGRRAAMRSGLCVAGLVLGLLAVIGFAAIEIVDSISN